MTTEAIEEKQVLVPCPSCGLHKQVSPMVVFWGGNPKSPCVECGGVGEVPVCTPCRGEGTRDPDPGEPPPAIGKHRCRKCQGWGTIGNPPTTADELGVPTDLRWLVDKNPQGRAVITHFLSLPMAERLYLMARAVRMKMADPELADLVTPGWEHHEQEEDRRARTVRETSQVPTIGFVPERLSVRQRIEILFFGVRSAVKGRPD